MKSFNSSENNIDILKEDAKENANEINKIIRDTDELSIDNTSSGLMINGKIKEFKNPAKEVHKKVRQIDVSFYINNLLCSNKEDDISNFLPSKDDKNYQEIISCIFLKIQRRIVLNNNLLQEEKDKNELIKAKIELEKLKTLKFLINKYVFINLDEKDINCGKDNENPVVLLYTKTDAGNVSLLNDLGNLTKEELSDFLYLFELLQDGIFKNAKSIFGNNFCDSFIELRKNKVRMTLERPKRNFVVVTGAFEKKVMRSNGVSKNIVRIKKTYNKNKKYILENLDNSAFIDEQKEITKEVLKILRRE